MSQATYLLDMLQMKGVPPSLSESVLVVVDAQKEYRDGNIKLSGVENALDEITTLLKRARALSTPIFHVVHHAPAGAPIFDPNGPMVEIAEQAQPADGESVIVKSLPSSFVNTHLKEKIERTKRTKVVLAGFMTHMCINATARSAVDLGFQPTVVASACATRELPATDGGTISADVVHSSNLASLADLVATIVNTPAEIAD